MPPLLLRTAFASPSEAERKQASEALANTILHNPRDRSGFLGTDPRQIAEALDRFPMAAELLAGMSDLSQDEQLREHIDAVRENLAD